MSTRGMLAVPVALTVGLGFGMQFVSDEERVSSGQDAIDHESPRIEPSPPGRSVIAPEPEEAVALEPVTSAYPEGQDGLDPGPIVTVHPDGTKTVQPEVPFSELADAYQRMVAGEDYDEGRRMRLVTHLGVIGTPEALELLTTILNDQDFEFPHRAAAFDEAFGRHVNDSVLEGAAASLAFSEDQALDPPHQRVGYVNLIARRGTTESAAIVLSYLEREGSRVSGLRSMADVVGHLKGLVPPSEVLDSLGAMRDGKGIYQGLASWLDPEADEILSSLALERNKKSAYRALAEYTDPEDVPRLLEPFHGGDVRTQRVVLHGIAGLRGNANVSMADRRTHSEPILMEIFEDSGHALWGAALDILEYDPAFHTDRLKHICADLLTQSLGEEATAGVDRLSKRIDRTQRRKGR